MPDLAHGEALVPELAAALAAAGSGPARNPGHRVPFEWPPHNVSHGFRVPPSAWTGSAEFTEEGEVFALEVAETPRGIFVRSPDLWVEARAEDLESAVAAAHAMAQPLFRRQRLIAASLGETGRFRGRIRDLGPLELMKLLFCDDRDVAHEAKTEIETRASQRVFTPGLLWILENREHPNRRSAQWAVLDLFEDLPRFCPDEETGQRAVSAIRSLIWDAKDDYARAIFKAGVVLGGHLPGEIGGPVLLECLDAPSKFGRRSAIHGLFHVVEWQPDTRDMIVAALANHAQIEPIASLAHYANSMARDINAARDHIDEPKFPEES